MGKGKEHEHMMRNQKPASATCMEGTMTNARTARMGRPLPARTSTKPGWEERRLEKRDSQKKGFATITSRHRNIASTRQEQPAGRAVTSGVACLASAIIGLRTCLRTPAHILCKNFQKCQPRPQSLVPPSCMLVVQMESPFLSAAGPPPLPLSLSHLPLVRYNT